MWTGVLSSLQPSQKIAELGGGSPAGFPDLLELPKFGGAENPTAAIEIAACQESAKVSLEKTSRSELLQAASRYSQTHTVTATLLPCPRQKVPVGCLITNKCQFNRMAAWATESQPGVLN